MGTMYANSEYKLTISDNHNHMANEGYFALTPDSYAWLRRNLSELKTMAEAKGGNRPELLDDVRIKMAKFQTIHSKAKELYGDTALAASCKHPSGRDYSSGAIPSKAEIMRQHMPKEFIENFKRDFEYIEVQMASHDVAHVVPAITGRFKREIPIDAFYLVTSVIDFFEGARLYDFRNVPKAMERYASGAEDQGDDD